MWTMHYHRRCKHEIIYTRPVYHEWQEWQVMNELFIVPLTHIKAIALVFIYYVVLYLHYGSF